MHEDETFSFCTFPYHTDFAGFCKAAVSVIEDIKACPSLVTQANVPNITYFTVIPWIHLSSMQHAHKYHEKESIPRITFGKYLNEAGRIMIPLSVEVHHALADGLHTGRLFAGVETYAAEMFA